MKVKYGKEYKSNLSSNSYGSYDSHKGSKTRKVVGLFMAAVLTVSAGCYLTAPPRQEDQEDKKDQNDQTSSSGGGGGRYYNYSSSNNGQGSQGTVPAKGGIGSSFTGGGG